MNSNRDLMNKLGPVGQAFFGQFQTFREVQRKAIDPIFYGHHVLLTSATASGKTEAIFAPIIARLRQNIPPKRRAIRLLALAPTRALVSDLYSRLEIPLSQIGWSCGRQTSDHREKFKRPDVLITTPESLDSMLVRDSIRDEGTMIGHLLCDIEGVFIDEAHLFGSTPRGDHVSWLLARLRRLKSYAFEHRWTEYERIQFAAASATVQNPHVLAKKIFGEPARILFVPGNREVELLSFAQSPPWINLNELKSESELFRHILHTDIKSPLNSIAKYIWLAIKDGAKNDIRKVLVFVKSRSLCDELSLVLRDFLSKKRDLYVGAHHGSLERPLREAAERTFSGCRDAVLVATTTLEVGIDIGDVDVVALVGAPPDTSSLLQRIGRSGRRTGCVRLIPVVDNEIEARAFSSMIRAACQGTLEPNHTARLWSVFVQQAASVVAQAGIKGRLRSDIISLAATIWPENEGEKFAEIILDHLIEKDQITQKGYRLYLGDIWSDRLKTAGGGFHHNFETTAQEVPVIDTTTGEVLTYIPNIQFDQENVALAGQRWKKVHQGTEIYVKASSDKREEKPFRYSPRGAPTSKVYAEHVRKGLGFGDQDAPVLELRGEPLWFHFGGSAYEIALRSLFEDLRGVRALRGLALRGVVTADHLLLLTQRPNYIRSNIYNIIDSLVTSLSLGRFHRELPQDIQMKVALEVFDLKSFCEWLGSRSIFSCSGINSAELNLMSAVNHNL